MNIKPLVLVTAILVLALGLAGDALASISNAAVLFLRIAPGSRAAGMGEAYVAIADDATATHWNPAGLGNYPLSDTWIEANIPAAFRPIKGFAPLSTGGTRNYLDYDIWAITPQGLIRYNNKRWNTEEVFATKTSQTIEEIVKGYIRTTDEARLKSIVERVAVLNSQGTLAELESLRDSIMSALPEKYDSRESISLDLDSLVASFATCRVNWTRVAEVRGHLKDGLKDGTLNSTECDRLAVSLERSRARYLPEILRVPYSVIFASEPTTIASTGEVLLIGSSDGLARFNGRYWEMVWTSDSQPVGAVSCMYLAGGAILVGYDKGVGIFRGQSLSPLTTADAGLPAGAVQAVGGGSLTDLYAVVDANLYHFDGRMWSDAVDYTVAVDDSIERIAARFSLYGGSIDKQRFIDRYKVTQAPILSEATADTTAAISDSTRTATVDSTSVGPDSSRTATADSVSIVPDSTQMAEAVVPPTPDPATPVAAGVPGIDTPLQPGAVIRVPLAASVKGQVTAIFTDPQKRLWLGTSYGIFCFDGSHWIAPGYSDHVVASGESLDSLVSRRTYLNEEQRAIYRALLTDVNDLGDGTLAEGSSIKLYARPSAQPVNGIGGDGRVVYFATQNGLIEFDGRRWARTSLRGLTRDNIVGVSLLGSESWIASNEKLVIKGRGHSEFSFMYVKWLPELADDLYYSFLSFVSPKEGWGTFGGNITLISYGKFTRTGETGEDLGTFESYDIAASASWGTQLSNKIKGGVSFKIIYSRLSPQGAGAEQGSGTATGVALDLGLLWNLTERLTLGTAITNLGPKMTYIDAAQSDDLPRNLAIGVAYRFLRSEYTSLIATVEANKLLVGLKNSKDDLKELIFNGGAEFSYANLFAARAGYIYDQEGSIKTPTLGFGLSPFAWGSMDFAYIPSQKEFSLANTLRISMRVIF